MLLDVANDDTIYVENERCCIGCGMPVDHCNCEWNAQRHLQLRR